MISHLLPLFLVPLVAGAAPPTPVVHRVDTIPNANHPQVVYWFVDPHTLADQRYLKDVDFLAGQSPFTLAFLTQRSGAWFYDIAKTEPIFKELVARAHSKGLQVGLQLWPNDRDVPDDQGQGLVIEHEISLDAQGHAAITGRLDYVRSARPIASELLRVFAFQKTAEGEYAPGTARDITARARVTAPDPASAAVSLDAPELAGATAYVLTAHYVRYGDLFAPYHPMMFARTMAAFRTVGFDGAGLDEFKYVPIASKGGPFRGRMYSPAMAKVFAEQYPGGDLPRVLFDMRYAPRGEPMVRARAINRYFDTLRQGPLRVEQAFAKSARDTFGPKTFLGLHDTFHNNLDGDEVWHTGLNWWALPRDYGHTDESLPMPIRLGVACSAPQSVMYNMYYDKRPDAILADAVANARINARTHYHAYNDVQHWGMDIGDPALLPRIAAFEDRVRLLNHFNPPRPDMDTLIVFGYPAQTNWFPDLPQRNQWDINGTLGVVDKARALWAAGVVCAVAPSYEIDSGKITVERDGIVYGGHRFRALVFIGPEYSKPTTLDLLERFTAAGGKLMLAGDATHDFDGTDIRDRFAGIAARATVRGFDVSTVERLGVTRNDIANGLRYEDGSVVMASEGDASTPFKIRLGAHEFSGSYTGLLALKADADGRIEKLAAGGCAGIQRDGQPNFSLSTPADFYLQRNASGGLDMLLKGEAIIAPTEGLPTR